MADSNISQILAALAAQRPAVASPAGQGQQQPPLGYQGWPAAAAPTPPAPTVGYSLPKPISSGSVDLSSIRPVNSGSVSLEDAVARAKGFATERGVVLDRGRGTPLGGDRRGQHPRSRSRSPIRGGRDSFRDNYNPYRDERREDARRPSSHNYSRDRSFSPSGGGLPGRPPLPSRYGHAEAVVSTSYGGDESASETITIDSNLVGLIIGRQGENLRRVEAETSTRVQFVSGAEAVGPQRQCKITGIRMARESAKAEIARIIEENAKATRDNVPADRMLAAAKSSSNSQPTARPGEDTTQILVPNRTVGLIIGRGGETIRDIQEKSGCHVNIVGEERSVNGQRPVNLIGSPSATAHATSLIDQVVMSDTKLPAQDAIPSRGLAGILGSDNPGGERINDTLLVPSEAVGMIIGKGGETIKDMQSTTGCKINVSQPTPPDIQREIGLVGSRSAIEDAKRAIMEKVHAVEEKNRSGVGRPQSHQADQYRQQQPSYGTTNPSAGQYGQSYQTYDQSSSAPAQQAPPADPYQAYGGYENYMRMWYASMAQHGYAQPQGPNQSYPGSGVPPS